jgi:membrane dipeptidase
MVVDKDEGRKLLLAYPQAWPGYTVDDVTKVTFAQPEQLPEIADLLLRHGYADQDVRGILGENFARVASQVWQ